MSTNATNQDTLFPIPTRLNTKFAPGFWPGITQESTKTLQELLKDNQKWHIFFNEKRFHNHIAHHLLAKWSFGATGATLKAAYEHDIFVQRPAPTAEPITGDNFVQNLSDPNYYSSYLAFFNDQLLKHNASDVVEKYIFSKEYNFIPGLDADKQPRMLDRFFSGLLHPMIHTGYGLEFGLKGTLAEGLAQTAVHRAQTNNFYSESLWDGETTGIIDTVAKLVLNNPTIPAQNEASSDPHVFEIFAKIEADDKFKLEVPEGERVVLAVDTMKICGEQINSLCENWGEGIMDGPYADKKLEELAWMNAVLYGATGYTKGGDFRANFFTMHLVTSSLFLSSISDYISPRSRKLLFKGYLKTSLLVWLMTGRPKLDIFSLMTETSPLPAALEPLPKPSKTALPSADHPDAITPNPWLPIIESSLVHPDDHLIKIQRALSHYSSLFGTRAAGRKDFSETGLKGAELLDGTLFIRVAYLTANRMGRVREGKEERNWD